MKILILGAGRVGSSLARTLSRESYDVSIVDVNKDKLLKLQEDSDLATVIGHASHPDTLASAGADNDTILLAVTSSDECNITACQIAKSKFNVKKTICRLSDASYLNSLDAFGKDNIDIAIGPENEVTDHLVDLIKHPGAEQIETFANGLLKVVSVKAKRDGMLVNRALKSIKSDMPETSAFVPAIFRKGKPFIPDGKTIIKENDELYFVAAEEDIDTVVQEMRLQDTSSSRVMIIGGGKIGFALAKKLEDKYKIKIIDPDRDRCEVLSRELNRTIVLNGGGSDEELLKSENIENIDVFCALTNDDETNIMSAFLAKKLGAKKTIILVNNYTYINILPKNFVDIALSPQRLTVSMVLQHLAEGDVPQDVIFKMESGAEAIEGVVHRNQFTQEYLGKPVAEIPLPENCVVAAVTRGDETFMGSDGLLLSVGDRIIVFILGKTNKNQIQNLFLAD
ncbi:Trk system potassium transporter TrkA [Gammaproteobacteria bacterium]|nr:Trk system potassium transporter TrkA [Gammaproteobacteria bacterium]MDA9340668.1 Trk system potassium transporter TrkA [Gammaproteobacteria bacterium]MDA9370938.1 Trk system potassium transporter TrkA [Gammaproteobacteria bacterium]MDA9973710.1 Trk system potassium transporter TrkA [Gammaproteobacteria bacterium]MDC0014646.1 Trk system potassium transporter TrkA [Gammaproteobacteria bacterium]